MEKVLTKTVKLSSKGQLVLPMALRRNLNLRDGDELSLELNDSNEIILRKLPSALDWSNLIADIPNEVVDVDTEGNYDPKKENHFLVEQLKEGDTFRIKGNRYFVKGIKIRTRYKCFEPATKKWYLFSGLYEVEFVKIT